MKTLKSARERETVLYGATPLGCWLLEYTALKNTSRSVALSLAHEYEVACNASGDYTRFLEQGRLELAQFVGCHFISIAKANKAMVEAGEWEVVPGIGLSLTQYRPSQRVIIALLEKKVG